MTGLDPPIRGDAAPQADSSSQVDQTESGKVASPLLPASEDHPVGRPAVARRRTPRVIAVFVLALLITTLVLLLAGPELRDALSALRPTSTPRPALVGGGRVFFVHSVPWGALRVDHEVGPDLNAAPRLLPDGRPVLPYSDLPPGHHLIQYDAQFFPHFECVLSIPSQPDDTCKVVQILAVVGGVLDLRAGVDHLEPEQFAALATTTEAALKVSPPADILTPGERYRLSDGRIVVAQEHLYAELLTTLKNLDLTRAVATGTSCVTLCNIEGLFRDTTDPGWRLYAHVVASWRYRRLELSGPADVVVDQAPAGEVTDDAHVLATIKGEWTGTWQVTPIPGVSCQIEAQLVQRLRAAHAAQVPSFGWPSYPDQTGTACLFAGIGYNEATRDYPTLYVLYRFGALIAANDEAHRLFPELPIATADEAALARQIACHRGCRDWVDTVTPPW